MFEIGQRVITVRKSRVGIVVMLAGQLVRVKFMNGEAAWFWPYEIEKV